RPDKIDLIEVPGWAAVAGDDTTVIGGWTYPHRLTRTVAGEELVAILIPPTRPGDPPPFYMLKNKVTNRVFQAEWTRNPAPPPIDPLHPGRWQKGATGADGKDLGTNGAQAGVPVV